MFFLMEGDGECSLKYVSPVLSILMPSTVNQKLAVQLIKLVHVEAKRQWPQSRERKERRGR